MTIARRYIAARPLGTILVSLITQLILLVSLAPVGWSQPRQDKTEDPFIAQHRQAITQNPEGVSFTLRILGDNTRFRPGEIISVEYSFDSNLRRTYEVYGEAQDRSGRVHLDKFFLDNRNGVTDPLGDYYQNPNPSSSMGGFYSSPTLGRKPVALALDLNQWLRFDQPGRFRLYVTGRRILKKGEKPDKGRIDITSNIVEFEILPRDLEWEQSEFQKIMRMLDSSDIVDSRIGCYRIRYFNTEAAASEMIRRYDATPEECDRQYFFGLIGSPNRAYVVKEMEKRLEAPDQIVVSGYLTVLSRLAWLLRMNDSSNSNLQGVEGQGEGPNEVWEQIEEIQETEFQYAERLFSVLNRKQGKARPISAYTLLGFNLRGRLQRAENGSIQIRQSSEIEPEKSKMLASELIAGFDQLNPHIQMRLLEYHWKLIAGPSMIPILRRILDNSDEKPGDKQYYDLKELKALALRRLTEMERE